MRIVIDLDGTICEIKKENQSYSEVKVLPGAKEFIDEMKAKGHTIVINTARNMQTQEHNIGKVMKNIGLITLEWLKKNEIYYDEIFFGKPNGDVTICDRTITFRGWDKINESVLKEYAKER
ncbi:HAD hydrolase family protein [Mycoplasma procyoni]|uniref:HAD hydrolase family protein n=1 Tax=Mycoplasma procyoni TaxID=568784 RepID=UPI00197BEC0D|nr:HAD hydrolase family protein [Mycoplasma procyoni]MBN3535093.1 HAD hydrolase family protein [Mycoplasma procyoni]